MLAICAAHRGAAAVEAVDVFRRLRLFAEMVMMSSSSAADVSMTTETRASIVTRGG